ncbi:hypothetical protein Tco_1012768 [Tanacetum coccineum]
MLLQTERMTDQKNKITPNHPAGLPWNATWISDLDTVKEMTKERCKVEGIDNSRKQQKILMPFWARFIYHGSLSSIKFGRESHTLEDVLSSLNSWELKKRTDAKDDGDRLYGSGMHYKGYDNGDLLMTVSKERFLEWIIDSGGSYHMTPRRDFLFDFKEFNSDTILLVDNKACAITETGKMRVKMKDDSSFVLEDVCYTHELKRNLISLGTLDREGYTEKLQNGRVKVINGSLMVFSGTIKGNYVYSLDRWAKSGEASIGIQENESPA